MPGVFRRKCIHRVRNQRPSRSTVASKMLCKSSDGSSPSYRNRFELSRRAQPSGLADQGLGGANQTCHHSEQWLLRVT